MVPPVPIPNTVVKHLEAESTCMETCWEDRKLPVMIGVSPSGKAWDFDSHIVGSTPASPTKSTAPRNDRCS